jgi:hypothetical protein
MNMQVAYQITPFIAAAPCENLCPTFEGDTQSSLLRHRQIPPTAIAQKIWLLLTAPR